MIEISIIVPVYNVEKYIRRCVDSIINQSFKNFELLLIDDGSTDESSKICDDYIKLDNRIKVFHKENGGLSSARNYGLLHVSGEYVSFIDSDDFISVDYCEYLIKLIKKHNADIVSADYDFIYDNQIVRKNKKDKITENIIENTVDILRNYFIQDKLNKKNDYPVWIKLYKRNLFETISFPDGKIYEDNITNFLLLEKCKKYVKSTKVIYYYFQREKSITKSALSKKHLALIDVANEQIRLSEKYQNKELFFLTQRKLGMSYFSLLTMYVRYGTDMTFSEIKKLVHDYKKNKKLFLISEKSLIIHILSFFMCININFIRKMYELYNSFLKTIKLGGNS